jgi:polar amino acid transport system substrate-binding protein
LFYFIRIKVFLAITLLVISAPLLSCTLVLAVSDDFPPYHMRHADNTWSGVSIDMAKLLVTKAGCELAILDVPWIRAIKLLKEGKVHILTNFTKNPQRSQFSYFLGPHHIEQVSFIAHKKMSIDVSNISQLKNFKGSIGITRGNFFGPEFEQYVLQSVEVKNKVVEIKSNNGRYHMLLQGRINGMFDDKLSADYLLAKHQTKNQQFAIRFSFNASPVYFGISKKAISTALSKKLNNAWLDILEMNLIADIYTKYNLEFDKHQLDSYKVKLLDL